MPAWSGAALSTLEASSHRMMEWWRWQPQLKPLAEEQTTREREMTVTPRRAGWRGRWKPEVSKEKPIFFCLFWNPEVEKKQVATIII